MVKPSNLNPSPLTPPVIQRYDRYIPSAFDNSLSLLEKVNKTIQYLHEYSQLTNEMLNRWNEVYTWVLNEGLDTAIVDRLNELIDNGTLDKIINKNIFQDLNNEIKKIDELVNTLSKEFTAFQSSITKDVSDFKSSITKDVSDFKKDVDSQLETGKKETATQIEKGKIDTIYKGQRTRVKSIVQPTILAYGDSNTRFYIGDSGANGSISYAYSSVIEREIMNYPNLMGSKVINEGHPSRAIEWALNNYNTYVSRNNPDIAIIGFGTNNIKESTFTMERYLMRMEELIDRLISDSITPIILGIPWFSSDYAVGMQSRLVPWNRELQKLCIEKEVEFVDVYSLFPSANSSLWFNETSTPKRHLNVMAQRVLGERLTQTIAKLNLITNTKNEFTQNLFDWTNTSWFTRISPHVRFNSYSLGTYTIDTLVIPEGGAVTFNLQGRYALGFYPREKSVVDVSPLGQFNISNTTNASVYYPIQRVFDTERYIRTHSTAPTEVTVKAVSGSVYLCFIASEFNLRNINRGQPRDPIQLNGADIPKNPSVGDRVMVTELLKEVRYTLVSGGSWVDPSGYVAVGDSATRTGFLAGQVPKGYKYWDTTVNDRYRADGNGGWTRG